MRVDLAAAARLAAFFDQRWSMVSGYSTSKSKMASKPGVSFSEHYLLRYDIPHGKVTYG